MKVKLEDIKEVLTKSNAFITTPKEHALRLIIWVHVPRTIWFDHVDFYVVLYDGDNSQAHKFDSLGSAWKMFKQLIRNFTGGEQ